MGNLRSIGPVELFVQVLHERDVITQDVRAADQIRLEGISFLQYNWHLCKKLNKLAEKIKITIF